MYFQMYTYRIQSVKDTLILFYSITKKKHKHQLHRKDD